MVGDWEDPDWEGDGDLPFIPDGLHDEEAPWRGLEHPNWPIEMAGPEYEMWRRILEGEEGDDDPDSPT